MAISENISLLDLALFDLLSSGQVRNCLFSTKIKLCPVASNFSVIDVNLSFLSGRLVKKSADCLFQGFHTLSCFLLTPFWRTGVSFST